MESKALFWKSGKMWAQHAAMGKPGRSSSAGWVEVIIMPYGSWMGMPLAVELHLVQGQNNQRKWPVQLGSACAARLVLA
jgi:hypothetical protein